MLRIRYGGELGEAGLEVSISACQLFSVSFQRDAVFEGWKARPLLHPRYGVFEPEDVEVSAGRQASLTAGGTEFSSVSREAGHIR